MTEMKKRPIYVTFLGVLFGESDNLHEIPWMPTDEFMCESRGLVTAGSWPHFPNCWKSNHGNRKHHSNPRGTVGILQFSISTEHRQIKSMLHRTRWRFHDVASEQMNSSTSTKTLCIAAVGKGLPFGVNRPCKFGVRGPCKAGKRTQVGSSDTNSKYSATPLMESRCHWTAWACFLIWTRIENAQKKLKNHQE